MHPLAYGFAALAALRALAVLAQHVQARAAGIAEPWFVAAWTVALHVGVTALEAAALFWLLRALPSRWLVALGCAVLLVLFGWTLADPVIYALAGDHLTPSLLAHFAGFRIFTSDYLWKPVAAHPHLAAAALAGVVAAGLACAWCYRAAARAMASITRRSCIAWTAAGAVALGLPLATGVSHVAGPPEMIYALDRSLPFGAVRTEDIAALRAFIGLPRGARWVSEQHPLVYQPPARARATGVRPDLVLISIESLRGQDLRWVTGRDDSLALPALEALARRAVVLPHFIANGFPSSEGFIATSTGAWPHDRRRIVLDFKGTRFDFVAARLRTAGYRAVRVEDDPDFGDEGHWVRQAYDEWLTFPGRPADERAMALDIARWLERHDRERPGEPVLIDWKTGNPHMPYDLPGGPPGPPKENYPRTLAFVDRAIGELVAALARRPRAADTVVLVLGDHSNWLESGRGSVLPTDEMVWTGALIHGDAGWIGEPRRDPSPASQVDIAPTLLALAGDERPTAALGRDLLARDGARPARAVAVRPGGVRLDEGGTTVLVDRRHVHGAWRSRAFSAQPQPAHSVDGPALVRHARTWGSLIENDRVWDPALLGPCAQPCGPRAAR